MNDETKEDPSPKRSPRLWTEMSVTELCADHPGLGDYIAQLESRHDAAQARIAAAETQVMVMRDEEAQRVKLKAVQALIDKNQIEADARSRKAMESIGISTHWSYTAGKTVNAMVLELVDVVKALMAKEETRIVPKEKG
jgi:hypothetical protein